MRWLLMLLALGLLQLRRSFTRWPAVGQQLRSTRLATAQGQDVASWPARELRRYLEDRGIRHQDCFEKRELVERVEAAQGQAERKAPPADDRRFAHFGELVEIPSQAEQGVLIFLHGFGDQARGFVSALPTLLKLPEVRYVLPTAPQLGGMRSWFTAAAGGSPAVRESVDYVQHLIRREIARGTAAHRIFVGGFSQGGCVAVQSALSFEDQALGGVVAASTFLRMGGARSKLEIAPLNRRLAVLCCHGEADSAVPLSSGQDLAETLKAQGVPAEFKSYPGMGHAYCPEEARDVASFLRQRMTDPRQLEAMSAKELKALLLQRGVSTLGCFEKSELLERAVSSLC